MPQPWRSSILRQSTADWRVWRTLKPLVGASYLPPNAINSARDCGNVAAFGLDESEASVLIPNVQFVMGPVGSYDETCDMMPPQRFSWLPSAVGNQSDLG